MELCSTPPGPIPPAACALQQHPLYGVALMDIGARVQVTMIKDHNEVVGQAQIVTRNFGPLRLLWLPRGPVWRADVSATKKQNALSLFPKTFGKHALWIGAPENEDEAGYYKAQGYRAIITPHHMAELDLTLPEDARLTAQQGKWRNRLRYAEKSNLRIHHRSLNPLRDVELLTYEAVQRRKQRYSALPPDFTRAWAQRNPKATRFFTAQLAGETLAYMVVLLHAPVATYHIGWTSDQGRGLNAHNLLMWRASNWLARRGYTRFDLGSVDTESTPGLARFKIGAGANIRALGPTLLRLPLPQRIWPRRHVTI